MDFLKKISSTFENTLSNHKKYGLLAGGILIALVATSGTTYVLTKQSVERNISATTNTKSRIELRRDACKLFTLQDAKEILGENVETSENNASAVSNESTVSTCSYSRNTDDKKRSVALTLLVRSSDQIKARQLFEIEKTQDATNVPNLGDAAYINPDEENKNNTQLNVLKDDSWLIIAITQGEAVENKDQNPEAIAKKAMSKM